ncbi:MAG: hypothetical protein BWX73_01502 [Lentisphaerae bacterium ADurb.Bin082]|nr:MAG: hypothetical protein BWX73_01502 [Lentisphaerae bacterium ADurb.Bin082]
MQGMKNPLQALGSDFAAGRDEAVLQLRPNRPLDGLQLPHFSRGHQGDGRARLPGSPRTPNPMHVTTRIKGQMEIEDVGDVVNI